MPSLSGAAASVRSWILTRQKLERSLKQGLTECRKLRKQLRRANEGVRNKDEELVRLQSQLDVCNRELDEERRACELLRRELTCKETELKGLATAFQGLESVTEKIVAVNTAAATAAAYARKPGQPYDDIG